MEFIALLIVVGLLAAAFNFGRNILFSLNGINEKLHSIYLSNANIESEIHELKRLIEATTDQSAKELLAGDFKKSFERANAQ